MTFHDRFFVYTCLSSHKFTTIYCWRVNNIICLRTYQLRYVNLSAMYVTKTIRKADQNCYRPHANDVGGNVFSLLVRPPEGRGTPGLWSQDFSRGVGTPGPLNGPV